MLNEKGLMTRLVTVENRVLKEGLHPVTEVHMLLNLHKFV